MWKVGIGILILFILAIGLTIYRSNPPQKSQTPFFVQPSATISPSPSVETPKIEVIAQNLEVPWALSFLPDNSILVTERKGTVKLVKNGAVSEIALDIKVRQTGESGLHGIAVDPKYPQEPFVYLYYTYSADSDNTLNKVSKFTFEGPPAGRLKNEQVLVDKIPGALFHDGGRIKFGPASRGEPDGALFVTTGDAANPSLSQDKNSLAGKILRIVNSKVEIYSYGHRNPQGIAWDNEGKLWETEHGQSATDEVNLIEEGKNYGWPTIRGDQTKDGMVSPRLHSGTNTWAPAGMAFFNGSIYYGGLRGQALFQLKLDNMELIEHFKGEFGKIRDVILGPDQMLYITTSNRDGRGNPLVEDDRIIKVNPEKL
ncbi:PQQ-dependent sugar dehydrogenase [Candidatus Daviesbacteria bacterium]|nr:PQQ-dependent sugar dehydrogenase [Candidatus Daviesbacteria bacterium]